MLNNFTYQLVKSSLASDPSLLNDDTLMVLRIRWLIAIGFASLALNYLLCCVLQPFCEKETEKELTKLLPQSLEKHYFFQKDYLVVEIYSTKTCPLLIN